MYPTSAIPQTISSNLSPHDAEESISEQPTYAVVDKTKKRKIQMRGKEGQNTAATQQINLSQYDEEEHTSEQPTYAVVDKKKKRERVKELAQRQNSIAEEERDPVPLHEFEQRDQPKQGQDVYEGTYAVVHKKSKKGKTNTIETATPIPSQTVDSPEELYTAVKKKPAEDEEEVPPLPPHTVEELYTAVQKNINIRHTNEVV